MLTRAFTAPVSWHCRRSVLTLWRAASVNIYFLSLTLLIHTSKQLLNLTLPSRFALCENITSLPLIRASSSPPWWSRRPATWINISECCQRWEVLKACGPSGIQNMNQPCQMLPQAQHCQICCHCWIVCCWNTLHFQFTVEVFLIGCY